MADTTQFTIEGPMTLAYHADEQHSKRVLIHPKEEENQGSDAPVCGCNESLETKIAAEIGFPSDSEFNEIFAKMDELCKRGLRAEGIPDGTREVQLRITVEVL